MSNAKFRTAEPAPQAPRQRLTPIQAMAKCIRDHRLFALYIELGGAAIDARIEYFSRVMRGAKPCMERELASEQEEWAKHEKNPEYRPRRVRPTITTREAMRAVIASGKAMEARNALMRDAVEAAEGGMVAQEVFLKRALKALESVRKGIAAMPLGCEPGDAGFQPATNSATGSAHTSAKEAEPTRGPEAHVTKEGAATPGATMAA